AGGRRPGAAVPRLSQDRGPEPDPRRYPRDGGDEAHRAPDAACIPALCDRRGGDAARGRGAAGGQCDAPEGIGWSRSRVEGTGCPAGPRPEVAKWRGFWQGDRTTSRERSLA